MIFTPNEISAICLSLSIAFKSILIAIVPSIGFGYLLARKNFIGKFILDALLNSSLVLPPVVIGLILLLVFGNNGPIGKYLAQWGIPLVFTANGAAFAAAVMIFPLMLRIIKQAIMAINPDLEFMAKSLGANAWDVFFTITLPNSYHGIIAAILVGFAASLGEFGAVITFAANIEGQTQTLALAIYSALQIPNGEASAIRLSLVAITISILSLIASEALQKIGKKVHDA